MESIIYKDSETTNSTITTKNLGITKQVSYIANCTINNSDFYLCGDLRDSSINNIRHSKISNAVTCKLDIEMSKESEKYVDTPIDINLINSEPGSKLIVRGNPIIRGTLTIIGEVTIKDFAEIYGNVRLENCTIGGFSIIKDSHIPFNLTGMQTINSNLALTPLQDMGLKYTLIPEEGTKLFRIKALKSFGRVLDGELGGLVSGFNNLSQEGNCWISSTSKVVNNSNISGDTIVGDNITILGRVFINDCKLPNNFEISGNITLDGCNVLGESFKTCGRGKAINSEIRCANTTFINFSELNISESSYINIDGSVDIKSKADWYNYQSTN